MRVWGSGFGVYSLGFGVYRGHEQVGRNREEVGPGGIARVVRPGRAAALGVPGVGFKRQKRFSAKAKNRGVVVTEAGSYLRFLDVCITQLKAKGPSRFCNESKEEEAGLALLVYLVWGAGIRADG